MSSTHNAGGVWWLAVRDGPTLRSCGSFRQALDLLADEGEPKPEKLDDGLYGTDRFLLGVPKVLEARGYDGPAF